MDTDWHDQHRRNGLIATATVMTVLAGEHLVVYLAALPKHVNSRLTQ